MQAVDELGLCALIGQTARAQLLLQLALAHDPPCSIASADAGACSE